MTVGDVGVIIQVNVSALGFTLAQDATCMMYAAPAWPINAVAQPLTAVAISLDGTFGFYTTTGVEAFSGGEWKFWLKQLTPQVRTTPTPPPSQYVYISAAPNGN